MGIVASLIRSDLRIPREAYALMTVYLLFAIGLKGGAKLEGVAFADFWQPLLAALFLSLAIPVWSYGLLGVWLGDLCGLSLGGATILGTLAASASYIAAPAAVRVALPAGSPAIYLTSSLALTFPFNVIIGIPTYYAFAGYLVGP